MGEKEVDGMRIRGIEVLEDCGKGRIMGEEARGGVKCTRMSRPGDGGV